MKNCFSKKNTHKAHRKFFVSCIFFVIVFLAFCFGTSSVSERSEQRELQALEKAVTRGITYCYAIEGTYPGSLAYLKENYGLTYNEDKYYIDYQPLGANIMPDVTILRKKINKEGFH